MLIYRFWITLVIFISAVNILFSSHNVPTSFLEIRSADLPATLENDNESLVHFNGNLLFAFKNDTSTTAAAKGQEIKVFYRTDASDWQFAQKQVFDNIVIGKSNSISVSDGLIIFGTEKNSSNKVFLLKYDQLEDSLSLQKLPDLPINLQGVSLTRQGNKIYIIGGYQPLLQAWNDKLFVLDLDFVNQGWQSSPSSYTGADASTVVQGNGLDNCLYIFGGKEPSGEPAREIIIYNLNTKEWETIPFESAKKTDNIQGSFAIGQASILLFQVSDREQSASNTKFGIFNTITQQYVPITLKSSIAIETMVGQKENTFWGFNKQQKLYELNILHDNGKMAWLDLLVLVIYFVLMLLIGIYFSKKQKTADDYFKAGKRIPFWAAGLSILGTGLSAITFMAVPAKTFATDWAYFVNRVPSVFVALLIAMLYIPVFRTLNIATAYEYLEKRFNKATRLIGSMAFILFQLGRIGIVLFLPAILINVVTGYDVVTCIIVIGLISLIYTVMGGIEAVIWTDVIQVIILYGGIFICCIAIAYSLNDGFSEIVAIGKSDNKFNILNFNFSLHEPTFWVVVAGSFFTNLTTYSTDQSIVQRYMSTKTTRGAVKSIWVNIAMGLLLGWLFFFMGTALFAFYKENPDQMLHTMNSNDGIFPWYIISQLPKGISGLLIAGIFAASMSSLSSSMNSCATAYTMDFHQLFKTKFDAVRIGRIATLIIGLGGILFAILFATLNVKSIWDEFLKIIGLLTGGLGGLFLLGITTQRANGVGALIGLLISSIIQYYVGLYRPFNLLLFTASGFVTCYIFGYLFSFLFPKYNKPTDGLTIFSIKSKK